MSLLNLDNVPGNIISGCDDDLLNWITDQSNGRYLNELTNTFDQNLLSVENDIEIVDLSDEIEAALNTIESESIPASTKSQMLAHSRKFRQFLENKKLDTAFEKLPPVILNKYLRYFYSELTKEDGAPYAPPSLICIRASLQRYLTSSEYSFSSSINIISGSDFASANRMLKAMVGKYLKTNKRAKAEEKFPPIEETDMVKIRASFNRSNPTILQNEFMFNCLYYFGLRGRETFMSLTKESFNINTDSQGRRYLYLASDRLTKNCKASLLPKDFEDAKKVRAYECERGQECPVRCYELYCLKLSEVNPELLQKPMLKPSKDSWYCAKQKVGKNTVGNLLANLSTQLQLSKRYTNHCVRVTTVGVLRENGYSNEEIASVTGHKNPNSVQRYAKKRKDDSYYYPSESLQAGSSATISRKVVPMGNGKIEVTEDRIASITGPTSKYSLVFSGQFQNCTFTFPE